MESKPFVWYLYVQRMGQDYILKRFEKIILIQKWESIMRVRNSVRLLYRGAVSDQRRMK